MAKNRMVNTRFWQDSYSSGLDPIEKLLFLYLITNNFSTLAGVYELPVKTMASETGIERNMVEKILARFERDDKARYKDGWVAIRNFIKHHVEGSPKVRVAIGKDLELAPEWARSYVSGKGIDTVSPFTSASTFASHDNTEAKHNQLGAEIIKAFESVDPKNKGYYGNTTQRSACDFLLQEYGLEEVQKRISVLPQTNKLPYFPTISTPVQLRDKWSQLENAVARKRQEKRPNFVL